MTSANNGSGRTWTAIIDCYAHAFGVIPTPTERSDSGSARECCPRRTNSSRSTDG